VLDAVIARLHQVNPVLNAVVALDTGGAQAAAAASTARWRDGRPLGPLDGVPFTVKDNIPAAGMPTSWGTPGFASRPPAGDELPVARMRAAGAVLFGKTNVPEFTAQGYTSNTVYGTTRNPWNTALTPGGSSGGAVAAVASGIGPIALGTDGGGSIRRPASHTGVYGLKPSRGRVARSGGLPAILLDYETIGPVARTAEDLALVMAVVARPDPSDPLSGGFPPFQVPPVRPCRILHAGRFGANPVDPEISASTGAVAAALAAAGHTVVAGNAPFDSDQVARIQATVGQAGLAWLVRQSGIVPIAPGLVEMAEAGAAMAAADLFAALDAASELRRALSIFFQSYDAILTPAAAALPWPADQVYPPEIAGQPVGPRGHAVFTAFANIAGLPGVTLPGPCSASGLPIGAQLVGPPDADGLLLAIAGQIERPFGWPPLG
jgi:aspartyl-tRNA(Asn)/glutamyl-tRNA(Gln) amidotransferase subunit A